MPPDNNQTPPPAPTVQPDANSGLIIPEATAVVIPPTQPAQQPTQPAPPPPTLNPPPSLIPSALQTPPTVDQTSPAAPPSLVTPTIPDSTPAAPTAPTPLGTRQTEPAPPHLQPPRPPVIPRMEPVAPSITPNNSAQSSQSPPPDTNAPEPSTVDTEHLGSRPVVYEPAPLPGEPVHSNLPHVTAPDLPLAGEPIVVPPPVFGSGMPSTAATLPSQSPIPSESTDQIELASTKPLDTAATNPIPDPNTNPIVAAMADQPLVPAHKSHRGLIISLIMLLILGAGAGGGYVYYKINHNKTSNQTKANQELAKKNAENNSATSTTSNTGSSNVSNLPAGYQEVSRNCFSLGLPSQDITLASDSSCFLQASYTTNDGQGGFNIFPETNTYNSLDAYVAAKKQQYNSNVVSEKDLKIDGLAAHTVIENSGTSDAPQSLARTYVLTTGKHYTYQGVPVTGFEIDGSYNTSSWQTIYNNALSTWQWK